MVIISEVLLYATSIDVHPCTTTSVISPSAGVEPPPPVPLVFSLDSSSSSSLPSSLELSDTKANAPELRARLRTAAYFCELDNLKFENSTDRHSSQFKNFA